MKHYANKKNLISMMKNAPKLNILYAKLNARPANVSHHWNELCSETFTLYPRDKEHTN